MKFRLVVWMMLGAALALYVFTSVGWSAIFSAANRIGWNGFAALWLCTLAVFLVLGAPWHVRQPAMAPYWVLVWARLVRDSAAEVLPFTQLGGMALGVRAAILQGISPRLVCASMVVDVTSEMVAQVAYALVGLTILTVRVPRDPRVASFTTACLVGLAVTALAGGVFMAAQRHGRTIAAKLLATPLFRAAGRALTEVGPGLDAIYRSPARVALSIALHLTAWIANAVGPWIAFRLLNSRIDFLAVVAIESLVYAIRSAAVVVPSALGVQEAAYAMLAPLFGVNPDVALAVSLLKRARDITLGVPVLLLWQLAEARRSLPRRA